MWLAIAYCYCLLPQLLLAVQSFSRDLKRTGNWRQSNDPPYECSLKDPFDFWSGNYRIIFYNNSNVLIPSPDPSTCFTTSHTHSHIRILSECPPNSPISLAEKRFWCTTDFITLSTSNRISFFFSSFFSYFSCVCMCYTLFFISARDSFFVPVKVIFTGSSFQILFKIYVQLCSRVPPFRFVRVSCCYDFDTTIYMNVILFRVFRLCMAIWYSVWALNIYPLNSIFYLCIVVFEDIKSTTSYIAKAYPNQFSQRISWGMGISDINWCTKQRLKSV